MQPRAPRSDIIVKDFDGDCLLFDEHSLRVHELNAAAASVWRHADGNTSVAGLTGLLEGPRSAFDARVSRRQSCQRLGLTGSLSMLLPLVSSIVASTPAMAQSQRPTIAPMSFTTQIPTASPTASPTSSPVPPPSDDSFVPSAPTMPPGH